MATKKNQPSKPFQFSTFFLITTIILGILTIVLYNRVEVLQSETHTYMREGKDCQQELNKLSDCPKELDQTLEYQGTLTRELEQEKTALQMQADSLKKVLLSLNVRRKSNQPRSTNIVRGNSPEKSKSYLVSNQVHKQYEDEYNQRVMSDVLRTGMKP